MVEKNLQAAQKGTDERENAIINIAYVKSALICFFS